MIPFPKIFNRIYNGKKYFISITVFGTSKFETPVFLRKDILKYIAVHNGS